MIAKELISKTLPVLKLKDKIYSALSMMDAYAVSHLPIVENALFIGLISEEDIYQKTDPNIEIENCSYTDIDSSVFEIQHLFDVMGLVARRKLTVLPVIKSDNKYVGSIISFDIIPFVNELLGVDVPGDIVLLELNSIDYSLSQISQIVEYNNSKILSLYTNNKEDSKRMILTLKIQSENIASILESFNRYDYKIKAVFSSEDKSKDIFSDRYDNLMNYLNI